MKSQTLIRKIMKNPTSGPYIALILLCVIASFAAPDLFPTIKNISNILRQVSIVGVVSIGMTIVLLIGSIDLSVTYVMAISACVFANISKDLIEAGQPGLWFLPFICILLFGLVIGLLNGIMVVYRNVESFIITLGMGQVLRGLNYIYTRGAPGGTVTPFWKSIGSDSLFGVIPYLVIMLAVLMAIFWIVLKKTVYGRHLYAIGSNKEAAHLSGIKVKRDKIIAFMLCGLTASIAGIMLAARVRVGEPNGSNGYDMDAIAAVVIGGTAMSGGVGSLAGTIAGVLIMAIMNNFLNLIGADPNLQIVIKGIIVLVAVLIQRKSK
ncbi:MAG: ABC transporter permease [Eubacterium sp.]|jgi:ribose transport system permease protein|nr:ABC transporter permease [Eubacterium sp.]